MQGSMANGGVKASAFIYSKSLNLVPNPGRSYSGLTHVTDWFPTFMMLASDGTWDGEGVPEVDGYDVYNAIVSGDPNPRSFIFHNFNSERNTGAVQDSEFKFIVGAAGSRLAYDVVFSQASSLPNETCSFEDTSAFPVLAETLSPTSQPTIQPSPVPTIHSVTTFEPTLTHEPTVTKSRNRKGRNRGRGGRSHRHSG
jgi:hypothetical protein